MMDGSMMGGGMWVIGMLVMLLVWLLLLALIGWGIVAVVRAIRGDDRAPGDRGSNALTILEERFARGEIDRDDFEERRRALRS